MSGKNKISVIVDDEAKAVLVAFQTKHKLSTRDEAVERILHEFNPTVA